MAKSKSINNVIPEEIITNRIYIIRGVKVMLDKDLALMYEIETFRLNESVKRNINRFPSDFMFQLTKDEFQNLISQFAISSWGGTRKMPFAFTEQGVAMLSGIINSSRAIEMNIAIMRAFVEMRKAAHSNKIIAEKLKQIEDKLGTHDAQFSQIYEAIENLLDEKIEKEYLQKNRKRIGFKPDDL